jgi:hypothetical protein
VDINAILSKEVSSHSRMVPVARSALPPLDNGWRMDHRADALPILFMLAAETNAAGPSFLLLPKQKTHRRVDGGSVSTL